MVHLLLAHADTDVVANRAQVQAHLRRLEHASRFPKRLLVRQDRQHSRQVLQSRWRCCAVARSTCQGS